MKEKHSLIVIILFVILTIVCCKSIAQGSVGLSASLDNRLTFAEDDAGNTPFTLDITGKVSLQGYQKSAGFTQISVKYEYADLASGEFHRYGVEAGYMFTFTRSNSIGLMPFAGYGILGREGDYARRSWEFGSMAFIRIIPCLKLITSAVFTERTDLPDVGFRLNLNTGLQFDIDTNYLNK